MGDASTANATPKQHLDVQPCGCILSAAKDDIFKALADASRRSLLDRLHPGIEGLDQP
jgi:hypothetical protein